MTRKTAAERLAEISAMDRGLWAQGVVFAGVDEVGRGPLAGPVAAGCVVMPAAPLLPGVDDSKRLSEKRREALYRQILDTAVYARVAFATVEEIDTLNILEATKLCMARAAAEAPCGLFLVDGNAAIQAPAPQRQVVGGDALCYSIAAASIIAKVERDRHMRALDEAFPGYGFAGHKGYGTAAHIAALRAQGACPAHRRLFVRNFVHEQ